MGLAKKAIYRIRKKLVKKIYIDNYYFEQDQLVFSLKLVNFLYIKNSYASIEYEGKKSHALVERKMRNLLIKVPNTMIDKIKDKANINLYINDEKMLISQTKNFKRLKDDIIIRKKYFRPSINKNIILTHRFSEYQFKQEGIHAQVENVGYEKVVLRMENESVKKVSVNHIQCFAIRGSKIFGVETLYNRKTNTLEVENFKLFPSGLWRLYINLEGYLHPIKLNSEKVIQFETNNHIVKIMNKNSNCYFRFKSRVLDADEIKISKTSTDFVELKILNFPEELKEAELSLLIRDTVSNLEADFLAEIKDDELVVYIRIDYLLESFSRKSFFIKKGEQQSKRYQFNLNKTALTGDEVEFKKNQYGEILTMNFYKRRDKSLGLKTQRPRISKHINNVEEFRLKGYLAPLEGFDNVKAYLGLQERETEELSELLITPGEFEIDVRDYDLLRLQTKQKTIIDFFVFIKNDKEEIIRKEKIKYIHANYKKDNYFSNKIIEENHKEHHYLLTVTPFKNLKIETFTIPSGIEIPKEVEMKDEKVWLIGERYNTAQDNGIVLFNWLKEYTDIEAYYVIESDAEDYEEIKHNSNIVAFGSKEHFEVALKAKVLLGTHDLENLLPFKSAPGHYYYENTFKVFLQHGVLGRKSVEYDKKYYDDPFDMIIVSSDPEKDAIVIDQWGYEEDEVVVTGLARFDNLIQKEKPKDILLMPTWRDWINTDEKFFASRYYGLYSSLLKNKRLLNLLEKNNVNLNFYPHYRAQYFFEKEKEELENLSQRVNFIQFGEKTVQQLLIDHALLITDYSSVSFDFIWMNKPVIYYHFDVKRFFKYGSLRPIEETFIGQIAYKEEELINMIEDRINYNFDNYPVDISNVIKYQDHRNCDRIYRAVKTKMNSK